MQSVTLRDLSWEHVCWSIQIFGYSVHVTNDHRNTTTIDFGVSRKIYRYK